MYFLIKNIHIICAALSITGFFLRGVLMIRGSDILTHRIVKILPHVIDAVLLLTAIMLVFITERYPAYEPWLTAKILALLVYIFLGMLAFKWTQKKSSKIFYWILSMMVFAYIVSVALTKMPLWFI